MTRKSFIVLACMSLLLASLACQFLSSPKVAAPTKEVVLATAVVAPTATEDGSAATQAAEEAVAATEAAQIEATEAALSAEATQSAQKMLARTAAVYTQATEQAGDFAQVVEQLREQKVVTSDGGTYSKLDDFEEAWAQIGWWQWWNTGYQPSNFVVRAHTAWESASRTADWFDTGCGFVFRAQDENNHYLIYLALDGYVYMKGYADGKYLELGREFYGTVPRVEGEADVMLVADGNKITYFVNGEKIFQREHKYLDTGDLAYTLISGTNKDFGTRCKITNVELWDMSEP